MKETGTLINQALELLENLIATPSFSGSEEGTSKILENWFEKHEIDYRRSGNNLWSVSKIWNPSKPVLLLNSHHDTVKPNGGYTKNPFAPERDLGKLYGLGSNDAGGALVSMLAAFTHLYKNSSIPYNLVFLASAEEETMSEGGIRSVLDKIPTPDVAIVGEPTGMHPAIAEKGLIVFDGKIPGTPGHAAHPNHDQAIMKLPQVLEWFQALRFEKESDKLGPVKVTVTQIQAGSQHNVIPSEVALVIDVRVNDCYTNEEIAAILCSDAPCELTPRSLRLGASSISESHPLVLQLKQMGRIPYGSPTLSDQTALSCPSMKLGPGESTRSHTADEYIEIREIQEAIPMYIELLSKTSL